MNYEVSYFIAEAVNLPIANSIIYLVPPLTGNFFLGIHIYQYLDISGSMEGIIFYEGKFRILSFIEIVGLNLYGVLSKDLSIYMKTFFNEIKKKSKCKKK